MHKNNSDTLNLTSHPLTYERWSDFETLFGERGACGGCWCMWWRIKRSEYERQKGEGNKQAMKDIVDSGEIPGLLFYDQETPVAWCSVAPREQFSVVERSRVLKPVDDRPVWSIVCFFVAKAYRNRGLTVYMLNEAVEYVKSRGGKILEGYPVHPKTKPYPAAFASTGLYSAFQRAQFKECIRRSESRPIMRYFID
jgi:GNAT superfamily N-acetyltransferase